MFIPKRAGSWLVTGLVTWFIIQFLVKNISQLRTIALIPPITTIVATLVVNGIGFGLLIAASWLYITNKIPGVSWRQFAVSYIRGNLARYIPGGIWGYSSRLSEEIKVGIPSQLVLESLLFEICLIILTGIASGIFLLNIPLLDKLILALIVISALVFALLRLSHQIIAKLAQLLHHNLTVPTSPLSYRQYFIIVLCYLLVWWCFGVATWLLGMSFGLHPPLSFVTGGFALAYVAGYVAIIVPSGIGVREGLLTAQLAHYGSIAIAGVISLWSRVLVSVSEIILLLVVSYTKKSRSS